MDLIADQDLERLASERGVGSVEANALTELRRERAQDKHVFAYRLGKFIVIGPEPSAQDEMVFLLANEATKLLGEADVKRMLGEPSEVFTKDERMTSRIWMCTSCSEMVVSDDPTPVPASCTRCGGIALGRLRRSPALGSRWGAPFQVP